MNFRPCCTYVKLLHITCRADDLVLISRSSDGLQKGLDALKLFCESRQPIVNTAKSKYMLVTKNAAMISQ